MSDTNKDALIAAKNKRIADLEAENKRLKSILSKKLGERRIQSHKNIDKRYLKRLY